MDIIQIIGSLAAILLLAWFAKRLFRDPELNQKSLIDYIEQSLDSVDYDAVHMSTQDSAALIYDKGSDDFIVFRAMGDKIASHRTPADQIIVTHDNRLHFKLNAIDFSDFSAHFDQDIVDMVGYTQGSPSPREEETHAG